MKDRRTSVADIFASQGECASQKLRVITNVLKAIEPSDLRPGLFALAVELLQLLHVHPAVLATESGEQRKYLFVTESGHPVAQNEAAAIVVDQRNAPATRWKHDGAAIGDHLEPERRRRH